MQYSDNLTADDLTTYARALNNRAGDKTLTPHVLLSIIFESAGRCGYCGKSLVGQDFEIEHIIPVSKGGRNSNDNLAVVCPNCNRAKSEKHPARFALETVARLGITTPLLQRILDYFDEQPRVQKSLFGDDKRLPPGEPYQW